MELQRALRLRLIGECADLHTSELRRDWLLHMLLQTHDSEELSALIKRFNELQLSDGQGELIKLQLHEAGFLLRREPVTNFSHTPHTSPSAPFGLRHNF